MKRGPSLVIREVQSKPQEMPPHPHWMATIKKRYRDKCDRDVEKLEPLTLLVEMENGAATLEISLAAP